MENNRFAIIDLGTNTFHLLAVEYKNGKTIQLHKERKYVKLAEDGIGKIGELPFKRGMDAMALFSGVIKKFEIQHIKAFGTAALRTASNGKDFVNSVYNTLGIQIELIPGREEARLIHKGVMRAIDIEDEQILIMDIGGGSVEFIIANKEKVFWSESFPIGVAVLFHHFHKNDPIEKKELEALNIYLENILSSLLEQLDQFKIDALVGASGTFDVLDIMIDHQKENKYSSTLDAKAFESVYNHLIFTTLKERLAMVDVPDTRADMIIVALELIYFILGKTAVKKIIVSSFALKEGILSELMEH